MSAYDLLATVVAVAALLAAAIVGIRMRAPLQAVHVLLDLLLAAGLLRLTAAPTVERAVSVALLIVIRRLASYGLRQGRP